VPQVPHIKPKKHNESPSPPEREGVIPNNERTPRIFEASCVAPVAPAAEGSDTKGSPTPPKGGACVAGGVARECREPLELDLPPSNPQGCSPRHQREHRVPAPQEWAVLQNLIHQHPDETNEALAQRMDPTGECHLTEAMLTEWRAVYGGIPSRRPRR